VASIKELGNGKYRIFICNGFKENGKVNRTSKVITAKSAKDAEKQAQVLEIDFKRAATSCTELKCTFSQLVDKWRELKSSELAEKTLSRYEGILKDFMVPYFGKLALSEIKAIDIDQYLNNLRKDGIRKDGKTGAYSQKTIRHHYTLIHKLFNLAVKWDMVDENIIDKIDKPKVDQKEAQFYDIGQIEKLIDCLDNEKTMYKMYGLIALVSACRRSEVLGLEWDDIDFENNLIKIIRVSLYTPKMGIYTKHILKSGQPSKIITMPVEVMDLLKEYKFEQSRIRIEMGNRWAPSNRLFIAETGGSIAPAGTAIHPDNISQWFEKFLKKNNMERITLHQLRHTSISYLLNKNVDINTVSERAGHRDGSITMRVYGHVYAKNKRESADKFSELLGKA